MTVKFQELISYIYKNYKNRLYKYFINFQELYKIFIVSFYKILKSLSNFHCSILLL